MKRLTLIVILLLIGLQAGVLAVNPVAKSYFNKASDKYLFGDVKGAMELLKKSLNVEPNYVSAKRLMQSIIRENKKLFAKEQALLQKEKNQLIEKFVREGKKLYTQEEFSAAEAYFAGALSQAPTDARIVFYLQKTREAKLRQAEANRNNLQLLAVSLLASYFSFGIFFTYLAITVERRYFKKRLDREQGKGFCFNCKAKISPNIDLCPNCGAWIGTKLRRTITTEQKNWYGKWGWKKNPFTLDIHPELFTGYRDEVKSILEKLSARSGHILITGPLGIGKTTLLRWLANYLSNDVCAVYVPRPPLQFEQLIKLIMQRMGFDSRYSTDYDIYHLDLLRKKIGKNLVILMDEAHEFNIEIERPLRTLGDLDEVKLVMAGLPESIEKLKTEIRPLFERLVLKIDLTHLAEDDLVELIKARIENAGGQGFHPFTAQALSKIYIMSQAIPRVAVKICDWAVTKAINSGEDKITPELLVGADNFQI